MQNRACWSEIVLEFNRACGPRTATRLCEALDSLFRDVGIEARRQLRLYPPVCCHVSPDELCILNLLAAHQAGEARHADALLLWLVPNKAARRIRESTREIARMLFETGYVLDYQAQPAADQIDGAGRLRILH